MKDPVEYALTTPVEIGDTTYSKLTLREPQAYQLEKAWNENEMTMTIKLISIVAKVPEAAIRQMTQTDLQGAGVVMANFSKASPETGES